MYENRRKKLHTIYGKCQFSRDCIGQRYIIVCEKIVLNVGVSLTCLHSK